ncbi:Histidine kinase-, DNA gyrase B-, and HSP90-like ATPase [Micromonospora coriariae]|uniref:Histidine kinase-, DNA gyrase B-, and HSP90-like ATPase n=1 Tax=Micromonospora coriariae TaxID=285665 RepID=A0A1C4V2J5_9ACTN|nr:ATP-binding protein [Micromonospora coriariae]SCE78320.1 Histidine kinase-, DNA gyrase B-, and HSP90-like ATPase [Micromonospora coriariae]
MLDGNVPSDAGNFGFEARPSAASLVESLRDFGYSLETALADIVDNSVSADATRVEIFAKFDGSDSAIGILDDGYGMGAEQLHLAMRLASTSPSEGRQPDDLGRFGMGMKTASFSQCRRMTVLTKQSEVISTARWDLDEVSRRDEWYVSRPPATEVPWSDRVGETGTLVVWQNLDRIVSGTDDGNDSRTFARRVSEAACHLEMVFHRFLEREGGHRTIRISVNSRELAAFDPFARKYAATIAGPVEKIWTKAGAVTMQPFTLPHHSNVDQDAWERLGGRDGFIKNQGFYLYRARRLIMWGTWFGIAKQTERTKLTRVLLDIPSSLDESWKINVLKASAEPPDYVRRRLKTLIEAIVATSKRIYTHRGVRKAALAEIPTWQRIHTRTGIRYQINSEHPLIQSMLADLPADRRTQLLTVLNVFSRTLPVDSLLHDMSEAPDRVNAASVSVEELSEITRSTVASLLQRGLSWERITRMLKSSPPFDANWEETARVVDQIMTEET